MTRSAFWFRLTAALAIVLATLVGLAGGISAQDASRPIRALLVTGGCFHDYATQKDILTKGISARANVQWAIAYDPDRTCKHLNPVFETADWAKKFDVVVHDECCSDVIDLNIINRILEPHRQGLPAVVLHCGMHSYRSAGYPDKTTPWFEFTGLATTRHDDQVPIELTILDKDSPITMGQSNWTTIKEEMYNNHTGKLEPTAHALMRGKQTLKRKSGKVQVDESIVTWTNIYKGKTKVFATTLGHNNATVADARYLDLVTRGLLWSVGKLDQAHLQPAKKTLLD